MVAKKLAPVHPGEVLEEEFLKPLGLSQHRLKGLHSSSQDLVGRLSGVRFGGVPGYDPSRRFNHTGSNFGTANINANGQGRHDASPYSSDTGVHAPV